MTTNWEILNTERHPESGYISRVFWKITAQEDETFIEYEGTTEFTEQDEEATLIPYEQVTKENIIEWIQEIQGEDLTVMLIEGIKELQKPKLTSGIPWETN